MTLPEKNIEDNTSSEKITALVPLLCGIIIVLLCAINLTGQNAIRLGPLQSTAQTANQILPQGWAFFTKDPRSAKYIPYEENFGTFIPAGHERRVDLSVAFGLNRSYRNFSAELENIERTLKDVDMEPCSSGAPAECFSALDLEPSTKSTHSLKAPSLCGVIPVARAEVVPFDWRNLTEGNVRVTHVAKIEIDCEYSQP